MLVAESLRPVVGVGFAVVGFVFGWLVARLSEWLAPSEEAPVIRGRSLLVRDPLVQGSLAVLWAAMPFTSDGDLLHAAEGGLLTVPLVQVAVTDLRTRYVYDVVALIGLVIGLAIGWHYHQVQWFWGIVGAAGGGLAFVVLYGLGLLYGRVFNRGSGEPPLARGDITIAAMVGAGAAQCAAYALFWGVIGSGLLGLGVLLIARSGKVFMPYGPGLCFGGLIALFFC